MEIGFRRNVFVASVYDDFSVRKTLFSKWNETPDFLCERTTLCSMILDSLKSAGDISCDEVCVVTIFMSSLSSNSAVRTSVPMCAENKRRKTRMEFRTRCFTEAMMAQNLRIFKENN